MRVSLKDVYVTHYVLRWFTAPIHDAIIKLHEGEVSLKELKDTVLLLAKQMVELKAAMNQREEIASSSSEYPLGSLPGSEIKYGAGRELVGGITPFWPFREARQAEGEWSVRSQCLTFNPVQYPPGGTSGMEEPIKGRKMNLQNRATRSFGLEGNEGERISEGKASRDSGNWKEIVEDSDPEEEQSPSPTIKTQVVLLVKANQSGLPQLQHFEGTQGGCHCLH